MAFIHKNTTITIKTKPRVHQQQANTMSEVATTFQMDRFSTRPDEEQLKQLQFDIDIDQTIMPDEDTIQMNIDDAMATSNKPNSYDLQTSIIDCALDDLEDEDDLKFEDINFDDAADDEFAGGALPSLVGPSWMPAHGFGFNNFDHLQFGMVPTHQYYNTGFDSVPQIHPAPPEMAYHTYHDLFPSTGDMFSSTTDLCGEQHHYRRPLKKRKVDKATFGSPVPFDGPVLDPLLAQLDAHEHHSFHKMPIKECAAVDMSPSAVAAREARKARRIARAKGQVLFLLDATVSEIEEAAVVDADYNDPFDFDETQGVQVDHLLRDYMCNFDVKTYVASVWDGVYSSLSTEKNEVDRKVKETATPDLVTSSSNNSVAANLINLMRKNSCISLNIPIDVNSEISSTSSSNTPRLPEIRDTPSQLGTPKSQDIPRQNHIVTPTSSDNSRDKKRSLDECNVAHPMPLPFVPSNLSIKTPPSPPTSIETTPTKSCSSEEDGEMYPDLPQGDDPESRRMRRLLRNRLSAQKSRDKRRKEIEGYKKLKVEKDGEIASLKKTLTEEMAALKKLEEMVNFAKSFLGPAKFATVV